MQTPTPRRSPRLQTPRRSARIAEQNALKSPWLSPQNAKSNHTPNLRTHSLRHRHSAGTPSRSSSQENFKPAPTTAPNPKWTPCMRNSDITHRPCMSAVKFGPDFSTKYYCYDPADQIVRVTVDVAKELFPNDQNDKAGENVDIQKSAKTLPTGENTSDESIKVTPQTCRSIGTSPRLSSLPHLTPAPNTAPSRKLTPCEHNSDIPHQRSASAVKFGPNSAAKYNRNDLPDQMEHMPVNMARDLFPNEARDETDDDAETQRIADAFSKWDDAFEDSNEEMADSESDESTSSDDIASDPRNNIEEDTETQRITDALSKRVVAFDDSSEDDADSESAEITTSDDTADGYVVVDKEEIERLSPYVTLRAGKTDVERRRARVDRFIASFVSGVLDRLRLIPWWMRGPDLHENIASNC